MIEKKVITDFSVILDRNEAISRFAHATTHRFAQLFSSSYVGTLPNFNGRIVTDHI